MFYKFEIKVDSEHLIIVIQWHNVIHTVSLYKLLPNDNTNKLLLMF